MLPVFTAVECVNARVYPCPLKFFRFRRKKNISPMPVMQLFLHAWSQSHTEEYCSIMRVVTVLPKHKQNVFTVSIDLFDYPDFHSLGLYTTEVRLTILRSFILLRNCKKFAFYLEPTQWSCLEAYNKVHITCH